ncbi:MAG: formylglycine-generating enzyme family protein, partial [Candidatus Riflebacteria bacterium]|nr:formylglycine-generating enzyme family protein [Candidatus Riflebacteria bacterium]
TTSSLNNGFDLASTTTDFMLGSLGWYLTSKMIVPPYVVGRLRANNWGLYDMHGNVEEWCRDWYGEYPTTAVTDPVGSDTGTKRVLRGGSLSFRPGGCRSAFRNSEVPTKVDSFIGFRVALVPIPEP